MRYLLGAWLPASSRQDRRSAWSGNLTKPENVSGHLVNRMGSAVQCLQVCGRLRSLLTYFRRPPASSTRQGWLLRLLFLDPLIAANTSSTPATQRGGISVIDISEKEGQQQGHDKAADQGISHGGLSRLQAHPTGIPRIGAAKPRPELRSSRSPKTLSARTSSWYDPGCHGLRRTLRIAAVSNRHIIQDYQRTFNRV